MEKKKYYKCHTDCGFIILKKLEELPDFFEDEDAGEVTTEEVWMTEEEYEALPEFEG